MNSSIWKVKPAEFYENDKHHMLILWFYMSLNGILLLVVPSGRLEFDQPCINDCNVWQKQPE